MARRTGAPLAWTLAMMLALAGCAPVATSTTAQQTATPAPTATSAPRTLYEADWSQRPSEWTLPPHWSIVNGALQNDGDSGNVIALSIPYQVTAENYSVHLQIRAIAAKGPGVQNMYGLVGQTPAGALLYTAEASDVEHSLHSYAIVYPATPDESTGGNSASAYDFTPGTQTRPYLVQVEGHYVSFTAGEGFIGQVKSIPPLAPARLVFLDQHIQLVIESLTITTP